MENSVVFFEWSDVNRQPITFKCVFDFFKFCENSNIKVSRKNYNFINNHESTFAVCKEGVNELVVSGDYRNLRKNFSKHKNS